MLVSIAADVVFPSETWRKKSPIFSPSLFCRIWTIYGSTIIFLYDNFGIHFDTEVFKPKIRLTAKLSAHMKRSLRLLRCQKVCKQSEALWSSRGLKRSRGLISFQEWIANHDAEIIKQVWLSVASDTKLTWSPSVQTCQNNSKGPYKLHQSRTNWLAQSDFIGCFVVTRPSPPTPHRFLIKILIRNGGRSPQKWQIL